MTPQVTQQLIDFAYDCDFAALPDSAVEVGRALLIDSIGCALAGHGVTKGVAAVEAAADFGSGADATIAGAGRASLMGATFANAELLNAIDMDSILRLTHVTPYVVPPALVATEIGGASGADLIRGTVLGHEIAARVSGAYTPLRGNETTGDGIATTTGYSSIIVGAAVAAGLPLHLDRAQLSNAFGIAAYMAPVPALGKYLRTSYGSSVKYTSAGWLAAGAVMAARLAERGSTGDREVLDGDYGFWRMCASEACNWDFMLGDLGSTWYIEHAEFKPYPSFRMSHPGIEAFLNLLESQSLTLDDIDEVELMVDPASTAPVFVNRDVTDSDSYISWAYVLAVSAFYPAGAAWHSPEALRDPRVRDLMRKVVVRPSPAVLEERTLSEDPVSRPVTVSVKRGTDTYVAELMPVPKGHPMRPMTADEFDAKFLHNASQKLTSENAAALLELLKNITDISDLAEVYTKMGG